MKVRIMRISIWWKQKSTFELFRYYFTHRRSTALLRRNVEEYQILAGHDVRHTVAIVGHGSEAATGADTVRMLLQVHFGGLAVRGLTSGQPPWFAEHLLQEGRIQLEILRHNVQTEQVPIDTLAAHGVLVAQLVTIAGCVQQFYPFFDLYEWTKFSIEGILLDHSSESLTPILGSSIALTHAADSIVQGRTVSVRPSRNKRVMDAS